jgi:hypothetical protein
VCSSDLSFSPVFGSDAPEELTLTWNGLALHFVRTMTPALRRIESAEGSTDLVFDGDVRLRLTPGTDAGGSITLSPVNPAGAAASAPLVVPYTVTGIMENPPPGAALSWRRAGRTFLLTLPQSARADTSGQTVTLPLSATAGAAVLSVEGLRATAMTATRRLSVPSNRLPAEASMPSEDRLQAALAAYADAAYRGWSASRYSAAESRWQLADRTAGVSEDIGVGLLAESIARGTWQKMFALWLNALALHQKESPSLAPPFTTSAYLGGVRDFANALKAGDAVQVDQVRASLER